MRLAIYILAGVALACGLAASSPRLLIGGACVYAGAELVGLLKFHGEARKYRRGEWEPVAGGAIETATYWVRGVILVGGLFASLGLEEGTTAPAAAGMIIYGTSIACWVAAGVITDSVAGIPMRMGPGGWRRDWRRRRWK
jgi:hypothetical protein